MSQDSGLHPCSSDTRPAEGSACIAAVGRGQQAELFEAGGNPGTHLFEYTGRDSNLKRSVHQPKAKVL